MPTTTDSKRPAGPPAYPLVAILIAVLLLGVGAFLWLNGEVAGPAVGGAFTLENSNGQTVTDRTFRGKYMLVYFGYTYCPDVCPATLNTMTAAMDKLGASATAVQPIFITVDPARDTVPQMKSYAANFTPRLLALTGTPAEIAAAAKAYRVYFQPVKGEGADDYSVDHSAFVYLMGRDGRYLAHFAPDIGADQMAAAIKKYL